MCNAVGLVFLPLLCVFEVRCCNLAPDEARSARHDVRLTYGQTESSLTAVDDSRGPVEG